MKVPIIQKMAEPAPASQNNGNDASATTAYCCTRVISLPAISNKVTERSDLRNLIMKKKGL